jgi:hypothetical protein
VILPGILTFGSIVSKSSAISIEAAATTMLIAAVIMGYGAMMISIGLALATWQARLGRAVSLSVIAYLSVTVVYPTVLITARNIGPPDFAVLAPSPFFAVYAPLAQHVWHIGSSLDPQWVMFLLSPLASMAAYLLLMATIWSFDRSLGRIPDRPRLRFTRIAWFARSVVSAWHR